MGGSLSSMGSGGGPEGKDGRPQGPATPQPRIGARPGPALATSRASTANPWSRPPSLGSLEAAEDGMLTWALPAASLLRALEPEQAGEAKGRSPPAAGTAASPAFAIPQPALPAAGRKLLGQHQWCLVCEAPADRTSLDVSLRWLGGPSYSGTDGTSVCAEVLLSVCCRPAGSEDGGSGAGAGWLQHPWLQHAWLQHGFNPDQPEAGIHAALSTAGASEGELAGMQLEVQLRFEGLAMHVQAPLPGLVVHEEPLILKVSEDPVLLLVDGFLSPAECAAIRELGAPHLKRSKVSAGDETPLRTSSSMFLTGALMQHPVSVQLDERVTQLMQLACRLERRKPLTLGEATQIVRYDPGQFYKLHLDNPQHSCAKRAATVMVYLCDVEAGGATSFPRSSGFPLQRALEACAAGYHNEPAPPDSPPVVHSLRAKQPRPEGLRILPKEGRAVIFWSRLPSGEEDKCSIHEAERVGAGRKVVCTRWCREDP